MLKLRKCYVLDENQQPIAVQLPISEFEQIEENLENYGLVQLETHRHKLQMDLLIYPLHNWLMQHQRQGYRLALSMCSLTLCFKRLDDDWHFGTQQ